MSVTRKRQGDNVIYTVEGKLDRAEMHQLFDLNYSDYYKIGDAIGAVIDFRQMSQLTISGLRVAQQRISGVVFNTPVAFVGRADSILIAFLSGFEALSSRGRRRFRFFRREEEPVAAALAWVDEWFEENNVDREAVRGRVTASPPLSDSFDEA